MRFGLIASHQYSFDDDLRQRIGELFDLAEHAAELGYDSIFVINHFVSNLATPQPISMMAKLLDHTGDMLVGTGILILPLFNPVHIAEEFATLDQLSGGRVILGVGAGYREHEFEALGVPMERRGKRLAEAVELIRALWSGEEVEYQGEFYKLPPNRIGVPPLTPGGPPIWIGAGAKNAVRRAARLGDAWYAPGNSPKPEFLQTSLDLYNAELERHGKPREGREYPVGVELYCAPTTERAVEEALPYARREYYTYAEYPALRWQRDRFDELVVNTLMLGSPEDLIAKIRRFEAMGFNHLIFRPFWLGMPIEKAKASLELFAKEVMPAFKG